MGKTFIISLVAVLALAPATGFAQDAAESETDAPVADTTSPDEGDLSLGTPEQTEPQVGQTYVAEVFTDWEKRCVRTEDGDDPCQLYQLLSDENDNAVAEINIFPLPEGQEAAAGATIITPLETLLPAQLRLAVDGSQPKRYPYSFCTQVGCYARLGFTADEVESFKRGASASVTLVAAGAPDQPVELDVSLSGFTAGWNNLSEDE